MGISRRCSNNLVPNRLRPRGVCRIPEPAVVLSQNELERLRQEAKIPSAEEQQAQVESCRIIKQKCKDGYQSRKSRFQQLDTERHGQAALTDLEAENCAKAYEVLERSKQHRMNQEPEIRKINEMINAVKCQAIREDQMEERKHIQQELLFTDQYIGSLMEQRRQNEIAKEHLKEKIRREVNINTRDFVLTQVKERQQRESRTCAERLQEADQLLKLREHIQSEEMERRTAEKVKRQNLFLDLTAQLEENLMIHKDAVNSDFLLDQRTQEHQRIDQEKQLRYLQKRQEEIECKLRRAQQLKELQEESLEQRKEREERLLRRQLEEKERMWRQREREEAQKEVELARRVNKVREEQVAFKESLRCLEARNERKFHGEMVERVGRELEEERNLVQSRKVHDLQHGALVRAQICDREKRKIEERKTAIKERIAEEQELRRSEDRKMAAIQAKLEELGKMELPPRYIKLVEKKNFVGK